MNHLDHELVDYVLFRKSFPDVHKWLDATYGETEKLSVNPYRHWTKRHYVTALKNKYGEQTREFRAGCMHVVCDWLYHHDIWLLPNDEDEVIEKLKEYHIF